MAELTVEMTYGRALFEAAADCDKVELIQEELRALKTLFRDEPELFAFFCAPVISAERKKAFILQVFAERLSPEMTNFLCVLADKRRGRSFPYIATQYERLVDEQNGRAAGEIYSTKPLSSEELTLMEEETGKLLKKRLRLENRIDPSLVGGVKIFVEGKIIDASVKGQLQDMKNFMVM